LLQKSLFHFLRFCLFDHRLFVVVVIVCWWLMIDQGKCQMHHRRRWRWWRLTSHHCFLFLFPFIRHRRHKQQSKSSLSQSSIIWWPNCGVVEIDSFIVVVCLIQNRRPFSMCVDGLCHRRWSLSFSSHMLIISLSDHFFRQFWMMANKQTKREQSNRFRFFFPLISPIFFSTSEGHSFVNLSQDTWFLHTSFDSQWWQMTRKRANIPFESKIGRSIFFYCSNRFFSPRMNLQFSLIFFSSYQQYKQFSIFVHWMNETIYDNKEAVCMRPVSRNDVCDPGTSTATALHSHRSTTLSPLQTMVSSVKTMRVR
jgi:hypothetical protein